MRIRRAKESDWDDILTVLQSANFHYIGGPEMREFPITCCFVAEVDGYVVGVGGYHILSRYVGKTTLLAVYPEHRSRTIDGIVVGEALQRTRLEYMFSCGVKRIFTNCDDERVIRWNCQCFGYRRTGRRTLKEESFGRQDVDEWSELVLSKCAYKRRT